MIQNIILKLNIKNNSLIDNVIDRNEKLIEKIYGNVSYKVEGENTIINIKSGLMDSDTQIKRLSNEIILFLLINHYKFNKISRELNIHKSFDKYKLNILITVLKYYDKNTDFSIFKNKIIYENFIKNNNTVEINLDTYFLFLLRDLSKKWDELINIANENAYFYIHSHKNYVELVKFLINNLDDTRSDLNISCQGEYLKVFSNDYSIRVVCKKEDAIDLLFSLGAKKINFYGSLEEKQQNAILIDIYEGNIRIVNH